MIPSLGIKPTKLNHFCFIIEACKQIHGIVNVILIFKNFKSSYAINVFSRTIQQLSKYQNLISLKDGIVEGYGLKVIYTPGGQRRYMLDEIQQLYMQHGFSGQIGFGKRPAILIRDLTLAFTDPNSKLTIDFTRY
jgi:hypothetical protein